MFTINGKYTNANVFISEKSLLEESAINQIQAFVDSEVSDGSKISIMPDCHAGKGCVIGFTQKLSKNEVVPSLVGCDIGCGVLVVKIENMVFDEKVLKKFDMVCHRDIKFGFDIWDKPHAFADYIEKELDEIVAPINKDKALRSIGSLGGGNHMIELAKSESDGSHWLVIHTGSRHLGLEVEGHYTQLARTSGDGEFSAVKDGAFVDYIHDMRITQKFAHLNRQAISGQIAYAFNWTLDNITDCFETIHNYIDLENMIVRKGAIRLAAGERAIIPMNMADGSLIVRGKGNDDWNQSGPHGAGRLMSRGEARRTLSMDDFKASMAGIYSTTVCKDTIDESKMAYKPMQSIIDAITDTADIVDTIKPIYNFKAAEKRRK